MNSDATLPYLACLAKRVNSYIDSNLLLDKCELSPKLIESVRYSALAGGKRIRPSLCIMVAEAYGVSSEAVLKAGCAYELIHTYSLIHDDLPAMDNDDYRRGRLTNHKVFGEATAILAGDTLLTVAFEWFASLGNLGVQSEKVLQIISLATKASGSMGMIGGQMLDLAGEKHKIDLTNLESIHKAKTGALIAAPVKTGAILAGACKEELLVLEKFSAEIGLLFQVVDDILDVEGDSKLLGKSTGRDAVLGKSTYPALLGINEAHEYAKKIHNEAIKILSELSCQTKNLVELTDYFLLRKN